jgi:hypothetical protein
MEVFATVAAKVQAPVDGHAGAVGADAVPPKEASRVSSIVKGTGNADCGSRFQPELDPLRAFRVLPARMGAMDQRGLSGLMCLAILLDGQEGASLGPWKCSMRRSGRSAGNRRGTVTNPAP